MKARDLVIGFIVIVLIIAVVLVVRGKAKVNSLPIPAVPTATPTIQQKMQSKFQNLIIPTGEDQIDLNDVANSGGMGIATRNEIIADLPGLIKGENYQAYLANTSGKTVFIGTLSMRKGGWILDYDSSRFPGYNKVIITQGTTHILEGSF